MNGWILTEWHERLRRHGEVPTGSPWTRYFLYVVRRNSIQAEGNNMQMKSRQGLQILLCQKKISFLMDLLDIDLAQLSDDRFSFTR